VKHIISEMLGAKLDNCKFVRYLKELVQYYFYHPVEKIVSNYAAFLEKEFVFEMSSERKIELKEV